MIVNQFPDRIVEVNQEKMRYFGGTAYLGLPTLPEFQEIIFKNLKRWGTAYGSSRNANIQLSAYQDAENFLANHIGSEAAVTVSSGMLAGKLVIKYLSQTNDCFYHFPNVHTAIQKAGSLPLLMGEELNPRLLSDKKEKITILTDVVPSFCTQPIALKILDEIPAHKKITLVIDESHSLGILGNNGAGIFSSSTNTSIQRKIMVASLGKAYGLTGGVIASDFDTIREIKSLNTFVSAAGMNPAYAQSIPESSHIIKQQQQKLQNNLNYLVQHLIPNLKINFSKNYPLIYLYQENSYDLLLQNKIIITHFEYPTDNQILNRIVITANHKEEDLEALITVLNSNFG